jgi:hypothetical protein
VALGWVSGWGDRVVVSDRSNRNTGQEAVRSVLTYEQLQRNAESLWEIATSGTKTDRGFCRKCNTSQPLDRADLMARVNAQKELTTMGWGRPREDSEGRSGFVLNRVVVVPGGFGDG